MQEPTLQTPLSPWVRRIWPSRLVSTLLVTGLLVGLALPGAALALDPEEYQPRGNRSEGVKPKPVSGFDLELLSVLADFREPAGTLPQTLRVKFFLPEAVPVHLTIREQRYQHYYWLDRVVPSVPWQAGFNEFSWPTGEVLRQVDPGFPLENLGVVVRLHRDRPARDEAVAPAILYYGTPPSSVGAYLFTMKPAGDARLKCEMFRGGGDTPMWTSAIPLAAGDQPVTVRWPAGTAPAGPYRLVVTGYFLDNNQRFTQTVGFFHQPVVP